MIHAKIFIKLSGETGQAYHIVGEVKKVCKETGQNFETIREEMTSGDRDHLIRVVNQHFDCFVFMP
jgi:hypothetical protein